MGTASKIATWFLWWLIYSAFGWVYETGIAPIETGHWVGQGFLYGPLRPVYGTAAALAIALFYRRVTGVVPLFFAGALLATAVEYLTSLVLEEAFGLRWWDYSDFRFNIDGRVSLLGALVFGVMMVLLIRIIHPRVEALTARIAARTRVFAAAVLAGFVALDICVTVIHLLAM
jgi:uncharacterized membrane protein